MMRQTDGTYFHCVVSPFVEHCQAIPPPGPSDGVRTMETAVPMVEASPAIVIVPASVTSPPDTRPLALTVKPLPALVIVPSAAAFSTTVVLYPLACKISSLTFARIT